LERAEERDPLEVAAAAAAAATGSAAAASRSGTGGAEESDEEDDELGFEIGTLGRFKRHKVQMLICILIIDGSMFSATYTHTYF
jgi:hypothetical protein